MRCVQTSFRCTAWFTKAPKTGSAGRIHFALARRGPARGTAGAAVVCETRIVWLFVFYGNNQSGSGWFRAVYLLSAGFYLIFYSLLWTRGRAIFLALALLFLPRYLTPHRSTPA